MDDRRVDDLAKRLAQPLTRRGMLGALLGLAAAALPLRDSAEALATTRPRNGCMPAGGNCMHWRCCNGLVCDFPSYTCVARVCALANQECTHVACCTNLGLTCVPANDGTIRRFCRYPRECAGRLESCEFMPCCASQGLVCYNGICVS